MIANNRPMFTICQDYYTLGGEVRISREKMMSICLTRFPISGLGKPKLYQNMWCFTRMWGFYLVGVWLWRISGTTWS